MELVIDGKSVHAGTGGAPFAPDKPCLLFLHGAGMDHSVWALQTRYFAHHGRSVLAVDLPGHGHSQGPAPDSIEALADWTAAVIEAAAGPVTVIGHSMGAITALETAARHPDKVAALALAGATPAMPVNPDLLAATRDEPAAAIGLIVSWAYGRRAQIGGMRFPGLWMLDGGRRLLERNAERQLYLDFNACNNYSRGKEAAAEVACPTLILCGAADRMTPARAARDLAAAIADSRLVMIPDSGHMMMVERPDETLDALRAFLRDRKR